MVGLVNALLLILLLSPILWGLLKLSKHIWIAISGERIISTGAYGKFCRNCGAVDRPMRRIRGTLHVELVLWLLGVLPGVAYSFWRDNGDFVCAQCGGRVLHELQTRP